MTANGRPRLALNLFWRTFFLLALLLAGGVYAWVLTLTQLELEPRAAQAARQIASLVNLSRAALKYSDGINRVAAIKTMSEEEAMRLEARRPDDKWTPLEDDRYTRKVAAALRAHLGPRTVLAQQMNDAQGLWVGFEIDGDPYWMRIEADRFTPLRAGTWFVWVGIALAATLLGSVAIARLINLPLQQLSKATGRIRKGEFDSRLDENMATSEIRAVNVGFNRMARELGKVEEERAVMLAGISHDLRTPLARLRLEAEISVADEEARQNMAQDIDQLDAIIDKFMDYARPTSAQLIAVDLVPVIEREAAVLRDTAHITIELELPSELAVLGDETELGRVFANVFENARRYGRTPDSDTAYVVVRATTQGERVVVTVRDHGHGVPAAKLDQLTTPFFRGDSARTAATGAGLGLAIVKKAVQRMGGDLLINNAQGGGLQVQVALKTA